MGIDKRRNVRVPFETRVTVTPEQGGGAVTSTKTKDISLKGIYCYSDETFPEGTRCHIRLELRGAGVGLDIEMKGHVVRRDAEGMALFFDEIDIESFSHLKNVLYYNTGDPERIDTEILKGPGGGGFYAAVI